MGPLSKYDNRDLWKHYDYRDYGIIAEPYFDLDFNKVLYLTDIGHRWDGHKVSIRDKVGNGDKWPDYRSTLEMIIEAVQNGAFPDKVMMNFHLQRWTDNPVLWFQELVMQNAKNIIKWGLNKFR